MKLVIQIPCFNEEKTLPLVFKGMPKSIPGIDKIEYQIIDDGSTDKTITVAKKLGVHHIVSYRGKNRRWLGRAFKLGVDHALKIGADILVNTDGDNQYPSSEIPKLVAPIVNGKAEIVIGDRNTNQISEFSRLKKILQRVGTKTTQLLSGQQVNDAVSGFRAYSREALAQINIVTDYTYTIDTLMQSHKKGLDIAWVPIKVNPKTRESRLIKNLWNKIIKSGSTILLMYLVYEPIKVFTLIGSILLVPGVFLVLRFLWHYFIDHTQPTGLIQSLTIGGVLIVISVQVFSLGLLAYLMKINRKLTEDLLRREKMKS